MDYFGRDKHASVALSKRSISTSFLERRLGSLSVSRREQETTEQLRGPYGLNLLWEPSDPRIDFIFVHGLRGGSRKTWSISDDPAHFWPKEWLPSEPRFRNVRIHSYGYNADWGEKKGSVLNIHDFGQALIGDIYNSPKVQREGDTPIVLIGHSMGGLVIKKAYLLAKQDPNYQTLGLRFHSLFFLATPHRGADSAEILNNILRALMTRDIKAYISDLVPNSGAIQVINDEFRHVYQGSQLWSFFETVKTNLIFSQELIVEKDSAIIGLPGEHVQLLNADHRRVCKFIDPTDSNYVTLRNAFVSTIDSIERDCFMSKRDDHQNQMKILSHFLGISESPESDFLSIIDKQIDGTCEWLTDKSSFHEWQDGRDDPPRLFWLNGDPATGKSTATGHVVKYLDSCGLDCSYYFFRQSDKGSSNVASLLRSLAFQMALGNPKVRQVLLKMQQDAETLPKDDERMIWRTIFVARIFLIEFNQPHYWVIDALDECRNSSTFFALLSKLDNSFPLRVFVTSRPSPSTERLLLHEKLRVTIERVKVDDTLRDIQLFLKANSNFLPVDDETASGDLIKIITEKSNGCFLWVALVLKELESTHSEQQIWEVLKDVPTEMDELYTRIFDGMTSLPRDRELAKAIFRWTVCTTRPLTTEELKGALQFDIKETFPRIEKSIRSVCGNLVQVDKQSRVKVAHQTVRAFLTKEGLDSEFAIDRVRENSRLAEVCLEYLAGDELKNPRSRRGSAGRRPVNRSTFVEYASHNFSEHVARSSSSIDTHFVQLEAFLNTNVLTWVELIAQGGNLYPLTQTAKNFRVFLERRAKYRSPLGQAVHTVDAWSNDLIHLVAAYGKSLLSSPASIHSLIPPTCPLESMLYKTFGNLQPCLKVVGLSETDWDDRLATITFRQQRVTAIACQNTRFAVGLPDGCIAIFFTSTLQEARKLDHEEPVRHLTFAHLDTLLASGGRRKIRLWNVITGVELWMTDHRNDILTLSFNEDYTLLMAATKANQIAFWNVKNGHERDTCPIHETIEGRQSEYRPPATHAQFSSEQNLLAIGHRQRAISFWDLEANSFIGQFYVSGAERYPEPLLFALVFNPNPDLSLLAACYQEEYLVVLDPWNQEQQAMIKTVVHVLAASPDGKTLAAGDSSGTIKLYDFESLRLLYRVTTPDYNVNAIMFSNNNLRLFDVRSNHCNVWEPAVLVRQLDSGDGQSENISEEIPSTPQDLNANIWDGDLTITAIIDHHKGSALFCGREDGSVVVFEATTGKLTQSLYSHTKNIAICLLCWNRDENILVSCDISGRFLAREVQRTSSGRWIPHEPLLDARSSQAIQQVIISPNGKLLLLSTATSDELWSLTSGLIHSCSMPHSLSYTRITHPGDPNQLLFISSEIARIYNWENLEELTSTNGVALGGFSERNSLSDDAISCFGSSKACVIFCNPRHTDAKPYLQLWPTSSLNPEAKFVKPIEEYSHIAAKIKSVIGIHKSSLLFLDHDGWVCSVRIDGVRTGKYHYVKHFFVPYGWHSGAEPILRCTCKGYIVLARRDEIAIFHKGLEFEEKVEVCEND